MDERIDMTVLPTCAHIDYFNSLLFFLVKFGDLVI
jgi:hypothetical protein